MIARGLAKGEVFEDGGLYYEVQSVLPNGHYISKRVDGPKEAMREAVEELAEESVEELPKEETGTDEPEEVKADSKKARGKRK